MVRHWFGSRDQRIDISCSCNCIRKFTYASLQSATNNFSNSRLIGRGGSARVYKGILSNGQVVAVKKYLQTVATKWQWETDFLQIVEVMSSQIRHRNIHQVIGCCMETNHWLLVSEYEENGNLFELLEDLEARKSVLNWHTRVAICIGIARGISYLHEDTNPRVIHRDIKSSNILLDRNFTAKITDFELVGFFCDSDELCREENVVGTLGYLDPEYFASGKYTEKVDVYSFGVVMLEIVSGRKVIDRNLDSDDQLLTSWVSKLVQSERALEAVDPILTDFPPGDFRRFIDVALLCTQTEGSRRPSMHEVVLMLQGMCNSCWRALKMFDTPATDYESHFPTAISFGDEGEFSASFTEIVSDDYNSELQNRREREPDDNSTQIEGIESSTAREQRQHDEIVISRAEVHTLQQPGIILSGSGDLVERLSQTTVFRKHPRIDFPEAVYPPFRTRVFRRFGSRNLYTF